MTTNKVECPECCGQGGSFYDRADSRGEHMTRGSACDGCDGTGEVETRCGCGAPGVVPIDHGDWSCLACDQLTKMEGQASSEACRAEVAALLPELFERTRTSPLGVETMADVVREGLR